MTSKLALDNARATLSEIKHAGSDLLELFDDQTTPVIRAAPGSYFVESPMPATLGSNSAPDYEELYLTNLKDRAYTFRLLDGALVQLSYRFDFNGLAEHRLAYLPAPQLLSFSDDPELFIQGMPYADAIGKQQVIAPVRFDFDVGANATLHPTSHLTLGQYKNCRIPVMRAVTPSMFLRFIVDSFYTVGARWAVRSTLTSPLSPVTLVRNESEGMHIAFGCAHHGVV